jgi:hypothetical protein
MHLKDSVTVDHRGLGPEYFEGDDTRRRAPWAMAGADSIQVRAPMAWYFGYDMRLSVRSNTLPGRAWAF